MKRFSSKNKKVLCNLQCLKIKKSLYYFSNISIKKKVSYTFPYKEAEFYKLKYFLMIII